jgi:hypothetical protein
MENPIIYVRNPIINHPAIFLLFFPSQLHIIRIKKIAAKGPM